MRRRDFMSASLQAALMGALVGCGGGGTSNTTVTTPTSTGAATTATSSTPIAVQTTVESVLASAQITASSRDADVDATGTVYESFGAIHQVQASSGGAVRWTVGSPGTGSGQFNVVGAVNEVGGRVYAVDVGNGRVQIFDANGQLVGVIGPFGSGTDAHLIVPRDVAVDGAGRIFVSDTADDQINVYDARGNFLSTFGGSGTGAGQLNGPRGIALAGSHLHVVDCGNSRINVYSLDGAFVRTYGTRGRSAGLLLYPWDVAVDGEGRSYVADPTLGQIVVYAGDGSVLQTFVPQAPTGAVIAPMRVVFDAAGRLVVSGTPRLG